MCKGTESFRVEKIAHGIDVLEDSIRTIDGNLLNIMLMDRTTRKNILWATTITKPSEIATRNFQKSCRMRLQEHMPP